MSLKPPPPLLPHLLQGGGIVCLGTRHTSTTPSHSDGTKRALADVFRHKLGSSTSSKKKKKVYHQTALVTSIGKNVARVTDALHVSIAYMILACNLPFSLIEDELFKHMLICAKDVNTNYTPPTAYAIGGPLKVQGKWMGGLRITYLTKCGNIITYMNYSRFHKSHLFWRFRPFSGKMAEISEKDKKTRS
jgi:hypothetical protein